MTDGRDPCLRCSPPVADRVTGQWGQFIRGLRGCQPEPTVFEREFAARVLREVPGLEPENVHPQYRVEDRDGGTSVLSAPSISMAIRRARRPFAWRSRLSECLPGQGELQLQP
jgi:hypothetical protein